MKNASIGSPLFILRRECTENLHAVLKKLSTLGYEGVEFLSFFGNRAEEVHDWLEELNLKPVGNHEDYRRFVEDTEVVIAFHKTVGCRYITIGNIPQDALPGGEHFHKTVRELERIGSACRDNGITLLYHNHAQEIQKTIDGKAMLEVILDETPEEALSLEPDLGWIAIGGGDPVHFLEKYKNRCPVIHLKDYFCRDVSKLLGGMPDGVRGDGEKGWFEFRPTGYGIANIPSYMGKVLECKPEWLVADHDLAYERDSFEDLGLSLGYIRQLVRVIQSGG